jgi:hypothetical protein
MRYEVYAFAFSLAALTDAVYSGKYPGNIDGVFSS